MLNPQYVLHKNIFQTLSEDGKRLQQSDLVKSIFQGYCLFSRKYSIFFSVSYGCH